MKMKRSMVLVSSDPHSIEKVPRKSMIGWQQN